MRRRTYLTLFGSAVVAGCTGSASPRSTSTPLPPTETATPTVTETATPVPTPLPPDTRYAADRILDAVDELEHAGFELHVSTDEIDHVDQIPDIETREPGISIGFAREELDEAEPESDAAQLERVEALRSYADLVESSLAVVADVVDVHDEYVLADSYYRSQRYDAAATHLEAQVPALGDAKGRVTDIRGSVDALEPSLRDGEPIETADFGSFLDDFEAILNGFEVVISGAIPFVRGEREMELGIEAMDHDDTRDDDYDEGEERFEAAIEYFEESASIFRAGEQGSNTAFRADIIRDTCVADRSRVASGHFERAAEAAQRRDFGEATEAWEKGHEERDRGCG